MMTLLGICVFGGAFAASAYAIGATVAPKFDRIVEALQGGRPDFHPLESLVRAERRIAVRRWAAASRPVQPLRHRSRAAA